MPVDKRPFVVWILATFIILAAFTVFVALGFPGDRDTCVEDKPDTCFCEEFKVNEIGKPGVRQPANTWFNLYAIGTSFLVAVFVYLDRKKLRSTGESPRNIIRSDSLIVDLYVFAVLFLGLGSMWFHASLTFWGGVFDGVSMYIYASFLVFYSVRRLWNSDAFFWIAYGGTVVLLTVLHAVGVPSVINIMLLVAAYLVLEAAIWIKTGKIMQGGQLTTLLWLLAVNSILAATLFWALSQTGGCMCDPKSSFQPHGMLWHPLAGVMAVLLYFYWREADDRTELGTN